jgi:hypothetical protein
MMKMIQCSVEILNIKKGEVLSLHSLLHIVILSNGVVRNYRKLYGWIEYFKFVYFMYQ